MNMADKEVQVVTGLKRPLKSDKQEQTTPEDPQKERSVQCGVSAGSYGRDNAHKKWRYDNLVNRMIDKELLIKWLMAEGMMANRRCCPICSEPMHLVNCDDRLDGLKWECRLKDNGKRHKAEISVRKGSWFEQSNVTLEEILKFSYWWSQDLDQAQIVHELGLSRRTGVDWDSFCRELCEVTILETARN